VTRVSLSKWVKQTGISGQVCQSCAGVGYVDCFGVGLVKCGNCHGQGIDDKPVHNAYLNQADRDSLAWERWQAGQALQV